LSGTAVSAFSAGGSCPTLSSGESCTIRVPFTPFAAGVRSATLSIPSNAANSQLTVSLTSTGVAFAGGPITLSSSSLTFNGVGAQAVTVTHTGSVPVAIGSIITTTTANPGAGGEVEPELGETNNCGTMLAAQSICTISVDAESLTVPGYTGTVTVVDSAAPGSQTISDHLSPSLPTMSIPIRIRRLAEPQTAR
jgi:trimeric autotransporter adhesin